MLSVVWFKRDLRVHDHLPLTAASLRGAVLPLYVYEPEILHAPDYATQHLGFTNECLIELDEALSARGSPLLLQHDEIITVLERLLAAHGQFELVSHEETGNAISYARDLRVSAWCQRHQIRWHETPTNGVVRRLASRDDWAKIWMTRMRQPRSVAPDRLLPPSSTLPSCGLLTAAQLGLTQPDKAQRWRGGRNAAVQQLQHFFGAPLQRYRFAMSSPLSAEEACSRLSPYLAFGVLSVREVMHKIWKTRAQINTLPEPVRPVNLLGGLKSFESRLHWHCHFIQKFESEPALETQNMHRGFDGVRAEEINAEYFARWRDGETGFPLVDACMKMLHETGWINFRMRALLISFSSYQCWNHWREPALHLAREFLDYEPGIHYPQVQMQSGVTGINMLRIYNPVKQAQDQDPDGIFVKRWLPQLAALPTAHIFEPWLMPPTLQEHFGVRIGIDYPTPMVDHLAAARHARETLWALRGEQGMRKEAQQVFNKHGSRRRKTNKNIADKNAAQVSPQVAPQLSLLLD
jgi:deoxyribodipyrimidine photo-lyase